MKLPIDVLREVHSLEREAGDVAMASDVRPSGGTRNGRPAWRDQGFEGGIAYALSVLRPLLERAHADLARAREAGPLLVEYAHALDRIRDICGHGDADDPTTAVEAVEQLLARLDAAEDRIDRLPSRIELQLHETGVCLDCGISYDGHHACPPSEDP